MSRIVFVNRFYWPETPATGQLLTDLATALACDGASVTVITSRGDPAQPRREMHAGVEIIRVKTPRAGRASVIGKGLAFAAFALGACGQMLRTTRRGSVLVCMTDPPLLGVAATLIARVRRAKIVHWVQDIYPDVAIAVTGHRWLRTLAPARDAAWRRADRCVTVSGEMAGVLTAAGLPAERVAVIENWPPAGLAPIDARGPEVLELRRSWALDDKFVVAYAGNLGRVHDLTPVLEAATALRDDRLIAFAFIGNGAQREALKREATRRQLTNVRFLPPQPRANLGVMLAAGDVHLVTIRPGCERFVFPSKLYGIAAAGRPVVAVGPTDCELVRTVLQHGLGRAVDGQHPATLANTLRQLADNPPAVKELAAAAARFGHAHQSPNAIAQWRALLSVLLACRQN